MSRVNFGMRVEGWSEIKRKLLERKGAFLKEMAQAIPAEAAIARQEADSIAPVASGELVSSSTVSAEVKSTSVTALVAYTDDKAAAVHEGIHWGFFRSGTKGFKWLERAFAVGMGARIERIAERLRRLVR